MANEKKLPKFELIEVYNEETERSLELQQKYTQQVTEAEMLVKALNMRYETAVKAAVMEDKDNAAELEEICEQLDKAERSLNDNKRMKQVSSTVNKRTVTAEGIKQGLNQYEETYQKAYFNPAAKKLRELKEAYIEQFLEVLRIEAHFNEEARNAVYTVNPSAIGVPYSVGFGTQQNINHKCITDVDLIELSRGQKPRSLQPLTKQVTNEYGHIVFMEINEDEEGGDE